MKFNERTLDQVERLSAESRNLLLEGKAIESVEIIKEIISLDPDDVNVCICASAQLIDAAEALQDISLAEQGIEITKRLLADLPNFPHNLLNGEAGI